MNLADPLTEHLRLTPRQSTALAKLGIRTVRDILFHFPARYEETGARKEVRDLREGERVTVIAEVVRMDAEKTWKRKLRIAEGIVRDDTGLLAVVWFNQPYIASILKPGKRVRLSGKISRSKTGLAMINPSFEPLTEGEWPMAAGEALLPVYPETYGVTSRWFRYQIRRLLASAGTLTEILPPHILGRWRLPHLDRALRAVHAPRSAGEAEAGRKRFAFEEVFLIQLDRQRFRKQLEREPSARIETNTALVKRFVDSLPFRLTDAQRKAIWQILKDLKKPRSMARLLEGDVGSGKTIVAAACALNAVSAGYQVAYMAPTEILARQHFEEFIRRLAPFGIRIGFLASSEGRKFPSKANPRTSAYIAKAQLLKWCLDGTIQILIGTHAMIERKVRFKRLGLAIVDEQHRFGVRQRREATKGVRPHFLSMSATPIPRTLALTIYGDLDLTLLDEMPLGREAVETRLIAPREREETYRFIREEVKRGGQAFVICPRIEDAKTKDAAKGAKAGEPIPDASRSRPQSQQRLEWSEVKSVKAEYHKLSEETFPDLRIGMIHGKMTPKEKESVMRRFKAGELDILVSTSVIEVGVDVPNASVMMIEGGERFGLATLHQFRGRVGRGKRKSYCLVFTTSQDHGENRRLKALEEVRTGFELAEYDLRFRGPGELSGTKQWGISDVGMEALKNLKMVEAARTEARTLIADDPDLAKYPLLKRRVEVIGREMHFE